MPFDDNTFLTYRELPEPEKGVTKLLRHAAETISTHGWIQEDFEHDGAVCLLGSLGERSEMDAIRDIPHYGEAVDLLIRAIFPTEGADYCGSCELAEWNDKPGRTEKEVLEAIHKAIDISR